MRFTSFKYNIQDRSCMSMFVYSKIYNRENSSFWFDKIYDDLKRLMLLTKFKLVLTYYFNSSPMYSLISPDNSSSLFPL